MLGAFSRSRASLEESHTLLEQGAHSEARCAGKDRTQRTPWSSRGLCQDEADKESTLYPQEWDTIERLETQEANSSCRTEPFARVTSMEEQQRGEEMRAFLSRFSSRSNSNLERTRSPDLARSASLVGAAAMTGQLSLGLSTPDSFVESGCWGCRESEIAKWLDEMPPAAAPIAPVPDHLFRGLPISRMLRGGPSLMLNRVAESDAEARDSFELSHPMKGDIDTFLSHTWSSNHYLKYLTLLYHFNGRFSFVAAHTAALATFLLLLAVKYLTAYGDRLPVFHMPMPGNEEEFPRGLRVCGPCFFVGCVVQLGAYLFGHLFHFRAVARQSLFLDKCCINQTDVELKREGIENVGGFVRQSRCMFVPWGDNYFERLWCTYEVAAFVRCKGKDVLGSLKFMPIQVAVFVFAIVVAGFVGTTGFMFMVAANDLVWQFWFPQNWLQYFAIWGTGGTLVFGVPKFIFCHLAVQSRRALDEKLENFSVKNARVAFEEDRALVEDCIVGWFGQLEVFNEVVQKLFPVIVHQSLGSEQQVIRYWDVLQENAGVLFLFIYDATILALDDGWRRTLLCLLLGFSSHLVIDPLFLYSLNALARLALGMRGRECAKHAVRALGVFVVGLVYPAWFAFCLNFSLLTVGTTTVCLATLVPCIFKR